MKEEAEKRAEEAREEGKEEKWIVVGQRGRRRVVLFGKQPDPMTLMPFFRRLHPVARGAILHQLGIFLRVFLDIFSPPKMHMHF